MASRSELIYRFLVSGIWHGASWNFVIWGAIHGFYLIFANQTKDIRNKIISSLGLNTWPIFYNILQVLTIFGLTSFAWIFSVPKTSKQHLTL
jgi:D-alanyl-lipoteichoic acid acyltransferase DltB (MBOAT superfamily)